ncbi:MAG: hypothetical protein II825_03625 [Paludibacteraceae bacterium]|nr:hypothetical protein [Paludibacteraceae bacterium]
MSIEVKICLIQSCPINHHGLCSGDRDAMIRNGNCEIEKDGGISMRTIHKERQIVDKIFADVENVTKAIEDKQEVLYQNLKLLL